MKWLLLLILLLPLGAQAPFTIISVEHPGLPPYEPESRIYRLNAGANHGLKVGERLVVRHPGKKRPLGHLLVSAVGSEESRTTFVPLGEAWPMKGDQAWQDALPNLPAWANTDELPAGLPAPPRPRVLAPPREGLIFFLPKRADLSPAGHKKLEGWVQAWGVPGKWVVQVPMGKTFPPSLQQRRAEALLVVLRECSVVAEVQQSPRTQEGPNDPAWVLHWD
jgi:hypothetical protein